MQDKVTVILSAYNRIYNLEKQCEAIENQDYGNIETWIWFNKSKENSMTMIPKSITDRYPIIESPLNFGVWGRFSIALNAPSKYILIIDDDTIPCNGWITNCFDTINKHEGVISTRGVLLTEHKLSYPSPQSYTAHGWCNPNSETKRVDFGCHSWFFTKQMLHAFWAEAPINTPMNYGEDMHLSYAVQKRLGLNTYVAAHPEQNKDMWGSIPEVAVACGEDRNAISWNPKANMGMNQYFNSIYSKGFKIINEE